MYVVSRVEVEGKVREKMDFSNLKGFLMTSSRGFKINSIIIKNINVVNKKLAYFPAATKAINKYNQLLALLTELLISDDDTGDAFREALNHIEKFRLEIKIKYREFLKAKELEMMSKQLSILKKEANQRLLEIQEEYFKAKENGRGK